MVEHFYNSHFIFLQLRKYKVKNLLEFFIKLTINELTIVAHLNLSPYILTEEMTDALSYRLKLRRSLPNPTLTSSALIFFPPLDMQWAAGNKIRNNLCESFIPAVFIP